MPRADATRLATFATVGLAVVALSTACSSSSSGGSSSTAASAGAGSSTPPATSSTAPAGSAAGGGVIGVDYPRSDTDFWNSYISTSRSSPSELGHRPEDRRTPQNDIAKLIANVQALDGQGAKAIVMAPQDTGAIAPTLAELEAKKIPVVTIDTRPDTGNVYMVVRADNRAYGTKACQFLGAKLGGKGKVVMFEGDLASINGRDRSEAFNDCMKTNYPGITVFGEPPSGTGDVAARSCRRA